jgi:transposase
MDGDRIVHGLRGHQVHNEAQRGEARKQVKEAGLSPDEQGRLCVVCDGAEWRWKHVQALCPQARQGLDDSHCKEYLQRVANVH